MDVVNPLMPAGYDVVWTFLAFVPLVVSIVAIVLILISPRYTGGGKLLWALVALAFPILGALGWFLFGRTAQLRTDVP